jgi:hypothetical protein
VVSPKGKAAAFASVAPNRADAEHSTGTEPVDPNPDAEHSTGTEPVDPSPDAEHSTGTEPVDLNPTSAGSAETTVELRQAPRDGVIIRNILKEIYKEAEDTNTKPPNIKELPGNVRPRLKALGYKAAGQRIQTIGEEQEFKRRRLEPGRRWRGNR